MPGPRSKLRDFSIAFAVILGGLLVLVSAALWYFVDTAPWPLFRSPLALGGLVLTSLIAAAGHVLDREADAPARYKPDAEPRTDDVAPKDHPSQRARPDAQKRTPPPDRPPPPKMREQDAAQLETNLCLGVWGGPGITAITRPPGGDQLLAACRDETLRFLQFADLACCGELPGPGIMSPSRLAFSHDGRYLLVAGCGAPFHVDLHASPERVDAEYGIRTPAGEYGVDFIAVHPGRPNFVLGGLQSPLYMGTFGQGALREVVSWDVEVGLDQDGDRDYFRDSPRAAAFSRTDDRVAVADTRVIRTWDSRFGKVRSTIPASAEHLAYMNRSNHLFVLDVIGFRIGSPGVVHLATRIPTGDRRPRCFALDVQDRFVVIGDDSGMSCWDLDMLERVRALPTLAPVREILLAPDGSRVVSRHGDDTFRLWPGVDAWPDGR